VNDGLFDNL